MFIALVAATTAFYTGPHKEEACVSSSPAEVLAAAQVFIGQYTEVQIQQAEAAGVDLDPPKTCTEVHGRGLCAEAAQAGIECCECPDGVIVAAETHPFSVRKKNGCPEGQTRRHVLEQCTCDPTMPLPWRGVCKDQCHPAASTVELEHGVTRRMDELTVGVQIRTPNGFEPVIGFGHADADAHGEYYRFSTSAGKTLSISPRHHLFANGKEVEPATVKVGDELHLPGKETTVVTAISLGVAQGAFHLFVPSGAYYVDGLLASDYLDYVAFKPVWAAGRYYVAARYYLGVPIKMQGVIDLTKAASVWSAADRLPGPLPVAAAPILFLGMVLFEQVNLAAENVLAAAMLAALGLGYLCSRKADKQKAKRA